MKNFIVYALGAMGKKDFGVCQRKDWDFRQNRASEIGFSIRKVGEYNTEEEAQKAIEGMK